jgi:hypothetical protein
MGINERGREREREREIMCASLCLRRFQNGTKKWGERDF